MDEAAPIIYARRAEPQSLTIAGRACAMAIALVCLAPLLIAARLSPSPDGYGSHTEMGLPACEFMQRTGLPCPSCGMTTSWTWFVRGNLAASFYVQPMGALLAFIDASAVWVGLYCAFSGRPVYRLLRSASGRYYMMPLLAFAILAWAWKISIHLTGHDGWSY